MSTKTGSFGLLEFALALLGFGMLVSITALAKGVRSGIGTPLTTQASAARSISVAPDGTGLPNSRGNARSGRPIYEAQCASCHGAKGEGLAGNPPLAGGQGTLATDHPLKTVGSYWPYATTVWDYINRAMPYQNPGSLRADEVYAVTAYVLYLNGIVRETQVLDKASLPQVRMPNRDGFIEAERPDHASVPLQNDGALRP
jgi:cytochrome c